MIEPNKLATLGLGFGALAVATLGLLSDVPIVLPTDSDSAGSVYGAGASLNPSVRRRSNHSLFVAMQQETHDEETAVALVITALFSNGLLP